MQFNYDVKPVDLSAYFRGREIRDQRQQREQQQQEKERLQALGKAVMSGDMGALQEIAAINPQYAAQLAQFQQSQRPEQVAPDEILGAMETAATFLRGGQVASAQQTIQRLIPRLDTPEQQQEMLSYIQQMETNPQGLLSQYDSAFGGGDKPAKSKEFDLLSKYAGLNESERRDAARVALGLKPRAVGSAVQTITQQGIAAEIAKTERVLSEGKETGKLMAELELAPKIKFAVQDSMLAAQMQAERAKKQKSNEAAFAVYEAALSNLTSAMEDASVTGPVVGSIMALTANDQMADGAVAMMAPVLKQMFRSAGEGTFTDQDQKLLMDMVPSRSDFGAARNFKLNALDRIVRAKLNNPKMSVEDLLKDDSLVTPSAPSTPEVNTGGAVNWNDLP